MKDKFKQIKNRKDLFSLFESINEANRDYYSKYGNWLKPHIKVFWIEINQQYIDMVMTNLDAKKLENTLYEINFLDDLYWIDISDRRIWQIYTFSETRTANRMVDQVFTQKIGVDRLWFTSNFMNKIQQDLNFNNRGIGLKYKNILSDDYPRSDFSAKLWIGREDTPSQRQLLYAVKENFSLSTVRFGKNESRDGKRISGQLYELFYNGHLTVNTSDDMEEMIFLFNHIKNEYRDTIEYLEKERKNKPDFVELLFSDNIDTIGLESLIHSGKSKLKLWLQPYQEAEDIIRYCGVDLHTGDLVHLDVGTDYSYVTTTLDACMNVAPRFGTVASRFMSSKVNLYHDGVELFA